MLINNPEALKSWLVVVLEPLCDADSSALARYVLALLKKDKPIKELKRVMIEQLDVFLGEATKPFVEKLFDAITSEEYLTQTAVDTAVLMGQAAAAASATATDCITASASSSYAIVSNNQLDANVMKSSSSLAESSITAAAATHVSASATAASSSDGKQHLDLPTSSANAADKMQTVAPVDETKTKETHKLTNDSSSAVHSSVQAEHRSNHSHPAASRSDATAHHHSNSSHVRSASPPTGRTNADKENQPKESRRRRASLRSRSRSRSHSNERLSRRSRSRDRRMNDREKNQRQFRNKSPPMATDYRHGNDRRRSGAGGERNRRVGSGNANMDERSPRYGGGVGISTGEARKSSRMNRSNSRSRSPSQERGLNSNSRRAKSPQAAGRSSPERHVHHSSSNGPHEVSGEKRQRCRDFDEKGYCVRGETCPWDHGINPVVFEGINNPALISMSLREYNPDAPDLWSRSSTAGATPNSINPFSGNVRPNSAMLGMVAPGAVGFAPALDGKAANGGATAADYARAAGNGGFRAAAPMIAFPFNPAAVATPLQRELIPIPVVDASGGAAAAAGAVGGDVSTMPPGNKRRFELEDSVAIADGPTKRKLPLNSRLGPRMPSMQNNCSLELRKVPRGLNSIAHLNNHFAKFGKIVNIQVSYEGDPEAAIVTFSTHAEANVAYRSTEAVLNNRFIKVFWHSNNQQDGADTAGPINPRKSLHNHSQYHLNNVPAVPTPAADSAKISNVTTSSTTAASSSTSQSISTATASDATATTASSMAGTATTAVAATTVTAAHVPPPSLRLKNNVPRGGSLPPNAASIRKKQEEQAKAVVQLAQGLRKRKQELLQSYVKQMKSALELVERCEPSDPQRAKTLATIKVLQETIDKLRKEIATETEQMQAQIQNQQPPVKKTKEQQKKELLDIELELIAQQQEGNDTTAIQKRLEELQRSLGVAAANAMGAANPISGPPGSKGALFTGGRPLPRGRASFPDTNATRIDRRPKTIVVTGFTSEEADFVLGHFRHFGEITKHDMDKEIPQLILSYATRLIAEQAVLRGKLFKDKRLQITWAPVVTAPTTPNAVGDKKDVAMDGKVISASTAEGLAVAMDDGGSAASTPKEKTISESEATMPSDTLPELRLEDEEEDEDSEIRPWRH